jgi:hypothetical protein
MCIFEFSLLGFSQYSSQTSDQINIAHSYVISDKYYIDYKNSIKKRNKSINREKRQSVLNDTLDNKIIATGLGYSRTPNNVALTLLILNKSTTVIRGTYISVSLDSDKKFVSTINLVLHGININQKLYIFPVIGINLYHVSVELNPKKCCASFYPYPYPDPIINEEDDETVWDYDMTYSLTFGTIFIFNIGKKNKQTFGIPITFTKHGISTIGLLIKINRK